MSIDIVIVQVLFVQPFIGDTVSQQTFCYSGSYNLSTTSSQMFPEP